MSTLHVEVTAEDIDRGDPGDPEWCPVALALTRVTNQGWRVDHWEGDGGWLLFRDLDGLRMKAPAVVGRKAAAFDNHVHIRPFAFDIEVPE